METSYFAKHRNKGNGVSISLSCPPKFNGTYYRDLNPTWDMLAELKVSGDEKKYEEVYRREILAHLDPHKVLKDFEGKVALCWEKSDKFCHRHIVRAWILENTGVQIDEIE